MDSRRAPWYAPTIGRSLAVAVLLLLLVAGLVTLIDLDLARPFDAAVIDAVRAAPLVAPLAWLRSATELGATWFVSLLAVAVGGAQLLARRPRLGAAAAATIGLAALANSTLKLVVSRARPDGLPPIVVEPGYSFPSGHTLSATVAYGVIAVLAARSSLPRPVRIAALAILGGLVAVVGLSRVYLGAHYPTDVAGGWLTGLLWVVLFAGLTARLDARPDARLSAPRAPAPVDAAARGDRAGPRSDPPAAG
jgi:undecaprenyl-diphosphatase